MPDNHPTSSAHPAYRPDIDGLRAVAVMSVVAFHAFPSALKGGFIGVDVFFVISGYLISTIILTGLQSGSFRLTTFYARRIRRIFPALIVVLLACYALGSLLLFVSEFRQLGRHIAAGATFVSNFMLFQEAGYFDNDAATKPLLHLWSLGIEEQFYLFLPGFLWFFRARQRDFQALTIAAAFSFCICIWTSRDHSTAAFYLPYNRFWELLAGSILADLTLRPSPVVARLRDIVESRWTLQGVTHLASVGGIALLAVGFVLTDERHFPGWWALLPVAGAILIIAAGPSALCNRALLSSRAMVGIGMISFPIYLWHWPLLTFVRIAAGQTPRPLVQTIAVALSVALAALTYLCVERPIRFSRPKTSVTVTLYVSLVVVGLIGYNVVIQHGFPNRDVVRLNADPPPEGLAAQAVRSEPCAMPPAFAKRDFRMCVQDKRAAPRYALLGDSKAQSAYEGFFRSSSDAGRWLFIGGAGGLDFPQGPVLPNLATDQPQRTAQTVSSIAIEAVAGNPAITAVVFANAIRNFFPIDEATYTFDYGDDIARQTVLGGYDNTAKRLARAGKRMIVILDNPTRPDANICAGRTTGIEAADRLVAAIKGTDHGKCQLTLADHEARTKTYRDLLAQVAARNPNVTLFDTTDEMCDRSAGICPASRNGRALYSYGDHISDEAAFAIGQCLNAYLNQALP